jgi:Carboxypeptidase regulatory-like domain
VLTPDFIFPGSLKAVVYFGGLMKRTNYLSLLVFLLLGCCLPILAQAIFGSIQGTVTDANGAVVQGARVKARNVGTGVSGEAVSNEAGLYFLGELRPGTYDLEIEAAGFQKAVQRAISLHVEDRLRADFVLKLRTRRFCRPRTTPSDGSSKRTR